MAPVIVGGEAEILASQGAGCAPAFTGHCLHCGSGVPFPQGEPGRVSLLLRDSALLKEEGF